jgi:predicted transcriptional regulator
MRYRSRTDIISQILDTAKGGATNTKILYKACLSHNQLKEYPTVLAEKDLLSYDGQTHRFKTTEKGLKFLKIYTQIVRLMDVPEFGYGSDAKFRQPFLYFFGS